MKINCIRINGLKEPIGYELPFLSVSFKVTDTSSQRPQNIAIRLLNEQGAVLAQKESAHLNMTGERLEAALKPRSRYRVSISILGDQGDTAQGETWLETGKMQESWQADWIAAPAGTSWHPIFRRSFQVRPGLRRARLYAAGLGLFEANINGKKLGDEYLLPGITNYEKRIQVITFPVDTLHPGENEISFLVGKGWYMGGFGLENKENIFGSRMAVIGEMYLDYDDGTSDCIRTDSSFHCKPACILDSGIYYGESIDQREGSAAWQPVEILSDPSTAPGTCCLQKSSLRDRLSPPIRVIKKLPPRSVLHTPSGETVLDFGQNLAGFPEFDADFPSGTSIALDFGEILQQGNFYNTNYRDARSRLDYVSDGRKETVRPHFTYFGFRYVRVTGWPGEIDPAAFRACVLHSQVDRIGFLRTGHKKLNRLYENTLWGLASNFIDMPTDCPQRSERLGWTGDAQVFAPTACYHMDIRAFFHKFIQDLKDEQEILGGAVPNFLPNLSHARESTSAWGDIATLLPHALWHAFGSKEELSFAYPLMKGWVDYMDAQDKDRKYVFRPGFQFGDWLGLDGASENSFKGGTDDGFLGDAYYYRSACLTHQAAKMLGKEADAAHYADLAAHIQQAFLNEYFTPNGRLAMDTQASYIAALKFGLWIDRDRLLCQFQERLRKDKFRIRCGFVGAPMLCTVLAEQGMADLAYDFLLREDYPGWLYSVNLGATTVWERWNSVLPDGTMSPTGMNSLNHYAYGSVMEFLYAYGAGLRPAEPGWKKAIIAPHPDVRLRFTECSYDSVAGNYVCNTRICADGRIELHTEIPFGCEAEAFLPGTTQPPKLLQAGTYDFSYVPQRDFRKPFNEKTPLSVLAQNRQAMKILSSCSPALAHMAEDAESEFSSNCLDDMIFLTFLPIEPQTIEKAITEINNMILRTEETT